MRKNIIAITIFSIFISSTALTLAEESITITTYYPSPYGVYKELKLHPNTSPSTCDANNEGAMYYDDISNQTKVCRQTGTSPDTYAWEPMGPDLQFSAGNLLLAAANNPKSTSSEAPVTVKAIQLAQGGTLRIKWNLGCNCAGAVAYGQIYRNGVDPVVPVGTKQSACAGCSYGFSEDISGWSPGDIVELRIWVSGNAENKAVTDNLGLYVDSFSGATVWLD